MELITLLLKFIGISAILITLYYIVYARTASFFQCRIFLTAILFVSVAISVTQIKIYPAAIRTVEVENVATESAAPVSEYYNNDNDNALLTTPQNESVAVEASEIPFSIADWALAIYLTVTTLLLLRYFYQVYKILSITRWGSVTTNKNYKLIRNNKVASPFSYFKNIYINRKLDDETLEIVLQHELCHIEHRHYIDTMVMEFLSILLWFNPLTWVIKHELRDIHEFQVDNSLIRNGLDIPKYQTILFAELMGYSPNIANGLHNSLIKKRFIMMNRNRVIKHGLVRKLLVLPIIALLFVLFSFTEKDDVIRTISIPQTTDIVDNNEPVIVAEKTTAEVKQEPEKQQEQPPIVKPATTKDTIIVKTVTTKTRKNDNDSILQQTVTSNETKCIELTKNQLIASNRRVNEQTIKYIETMTDRTLVTVIVPITKNIECFKFQHGLAIKNPKTGERFRIISVMKNIPINDFIIIKDMKGKCLEFTMVFPPLKEDITFIDILTGNEGFKVNRLPLGFKLMGYDETTIPFTSTFYFRDIEIEKYKKVDYNYYYLTAEQTPIIKLWDKRRRIDAKLLSVARTETETLVTFATKIYYDSQWISFDDGMMLRDCKTKEKYYIKRVEKEIPLNRLCVVKGKNGEYVMYTMVFPRLPDRVDKIDIISTPHINTVPTPQSGNPLNWYNISVKNNRFDPDDINTFLNGKSTHPAARLETTIESDSKPKMLLRINRNRSTNLTVTLNKSEVINIPNDFAIRDVASGKLFRARRVSPYNFGIAVGGQKGDRIFFEFDNLPYGVDRIDIGVFTKNGEVEHPWSYNNIEINN